MRAMDKLVPIGGVPYELVNTGRPIFCGGRLSMTGIDHRRRQILVDELLPQEHRERAIACAVSCAAEQLYRRRSRAASAG
jgi:hypothetical protein